jgi:excisionase family DNA binding protein
MGDDGYMTMREAQAALGVSNHTIWRMVRDGRLPVYATETDRRKKLVSRADVERLTQVRPASNRASVADDDIGRTAGGIG